MRLNKIDKTCFLKLLQKFTTVYKCLAVIPATNVQCTNLNEMFFSACPQFCRSTSIMWKFRTCLVPRQYRRANVGTGVVLAIYRVENGWILVFVRNVTRLGVVCRYWGGTKNDIVPAPKVHLNIY